MRICFLCIAFFIAHIAIAQDNANSSETPPAAQSTASQTPGNGKKIHRFGFGFGGTNQPVPEYAEFADYELKEIITVPLMKLYYEQFQRSSAGVGISLNAVGEFEKHERDSKNHIANIYYGWKLYMSAYAFKDFDIKNAFTVGVSGGPAAVLNIVYADPEQNEYQGTATSTGIGLHFGQYVLKYLSVNKKDKKAFFVRTGFDQYVTTKGGFTGAFYIALGF